MAELHPKWIIEDGTFKLRKATFHRDIADDPRQSEKIRGGWYSIDTENKVICLYGKSEDFGGATLELVEQSLGQGNVDMYTQRLLRKFMWMFTTRNDCPKMGSPDWVQIKIKNKVDLLTELYKSNEIYKALYDKYCLEGSSLLDATQIAWNIITDYDDWFNTHVKGINPKDRTVPEPYSKELYTKITDIIED